MYADSSKKSRREKWHEDPQPANKIKAIIALKNAFLPTLDDILADYRNRFDLDIDPRNIEIHTGRFSFEIGMERYTIYLMPVAIPWLSLEGPCALAWYWPKATISMQSHTAHLLITTETTVDTSTDALARVMTLTRMSAAAAAKSDSVGVYWDAGGVIQEAQEFIFSAEEMSKDELPLNLWIDFRIEDAPGERFKLFTTGMRVFGHREIEVRPARINPDEILSTVFNVACYLLLNGPVIKDGNTIGATDEDRMLVQYGPSMFEREQVMILRM
ncbi:MAG: DUF4261 domain-containing protein [Acidobacteriota bacterium]